MTVGQELRLFDTSGRTLWTANLGPRRYLVGVGAFAADGARITIVALDGCLDACDAAALGDRRWSFGYLDAATGVDAPGPALEPVTAMAVRGLGWRHGTDLVVETYRPERDAHKRPGAWFNDTGYWEVGDARLVALRPGGGVEILLDPPDNVIAMDVPRDLVEAGRFGGPSPEPEALPVRRLFLVYAAVLAAFALVLMVGALVLWRVVRRQRRRIPTAHLLSRAP